jgi:formate/nitrite transporter FocA (FNT family)
MFKQHHILSYAKYSLLAAIAYSVMASVYIHQQTFSQSWLLYIGNALFALAIAFFLVFDNRRRNINVGTTTMITAGHLATIMGVILSAIITLALLAILAPNVYSVSGNSTILENAPPQSLGRAHHGLFMQLLMNAIIGNIVAGFFISVLLPASLIRKEEETNP